MTTSEIRRELLLISQYTRSDEWPKVRRLFLKLHPTCAVCGARKRVQAHHIKPYYLWPELELDPVNLITLCETGANHHLFIGHLQSYKSYNVNVIADAATWWWRIKSRPKWKEIV